jgi:hypothetical protein
MAWISLASENTSDDSGRSDTLSSQKRALHFIASGTHFAPHIAGPNHAQGGIRPGNASLLTSRSIKASSPQGCCSTDLPN